MKRIGLAILVCALAATGASYAQVYCVEHVGFCDRVEIMNDGPLLYGRWDTGCDGTFSTPTIGRGSGGTATLSVDWGSGDAYLYVYDVETSTWSNFYTDGFSLTPILAGGDFTITPGACVVKAEVRGKRSIDK